MAELRDIGFRPFVLLSADSNAQLQDIVMLARWRIGEPLTLCEMGAIDELVRQTKEASSSAAGTQRFVLKV